VPKLDTYPRPAASPWTLQSNDGGSATGATKSHGTVRDRARRRQKWGSTIPLGSYRPTPMTSGTALLTEH